MIKPEEQGVFSVAGPVEELELEDALWEHLQERGTYDKHRVSLSEILEVHQLNPKFFVNSSTTGRAPLVMVGPTKESRFLCIPVEPTGKWGVWRAVTAFEANTHHRDKYGGE